MTWRIKIILMTVLVLSVGCSKNDTGTDLASDDVANSMATVEPAGPEPADSGGRMVRYTEQREPCADYHPHRKPLFGELHVHTALSFDAVAARTKTYPEDAYRFARGEAIPFFPVDDSGEPAGKIQIDRALDFAAITDHGEFLGEIELCRNPESPSYAGEFCAKYREIEMQGTLMFADMISRESAERVKLVCGEDGQLCSEYAKRPWTRIADAAEAAYDRSADCEFTSFVGYEYTGTPNDSNYHRNVIFRNANVPALPVTYVEAPRDYMLWSRLDAVCNDRHNCQYLTIPHNSNLANGRLLTPYADLEPSLENRIQYARARQRSEPIVEIFQHKGASECMNGFSSIIGAPDELCDFEQARQWDAIANIRLRKLVGTDVVFDEQPTKLETKECGDGFGQGGMFGNGCVSANDFIRSALLTGLAEELETGENPVKMGMIAATDGHSGTPGSVAEDRWQGYVTGEMTLEKRLAPGILPSGIRGNPGGLAGVWAVENSRDAIFEALLRREVFGTSGPRITPRFFAGWGFPADSCNAPGLVERGYNEGVPMGSDLPRAPETGARPSFIVSAYRDPAAGATPLQALQLIKGWIAPDGAKHYEVRDVAGNRNSGAGVDMATGERFGEGYDSLCAVVTDEDFDPQAPAYYYLRALENPSPRWSMLECLRMEQAARPASCDTAENIIQEMAWTSPVWYSPAGQASASDP